MWKTKILLLLFFQIIAFSKISSQNKDIELGKFKKYSHINMGGLFNTFSGNIGEFLGKGGGGNMDFNFGKNKFFYGLTMQFIAANKKKNFTTPPGYEHYDDPSLLTLGGHVGFILGQHQKSHFRTTFGLGYTSIYHKKKGKEIATYDGVSPSIEFSRSFKFGKILYSEYSYTSNFTPPTFDPKCRIQYIEVFIGYKKLIMNNQEGNGNLFSAGLRYAFNDYRLFKK